MANTFKENCGVVYTKSWVVNLMLDLAGYVAATDLARHVAVEPAAGDGAFLLPMVERLLQSASLHNRTFLECRNAIRAVELNSLSAEVLRRTLLAFLKTKKVPDVEAQSLCNGWIKTSDYLLDKTIAIEKADFVLGNPPYIRLEDLEPTVAAKYREKYPTMVGRADIYIAFFEAALKQLAPGGVCAFICADRWMRNQYGSALRKYITSDFNVETIIEMHHADAFESDVSAYPAISVIRKNIQSDVVVASVITKGDLDTPSGAKLAKAIDVARQGHSASNGSANVEAVRVESWFNGTEPWACGSPEKLSLLKRLESEYYPLESGLTQTTVGIGVATGADKVYITTDAEIVEASRLLPMAMAYDSENGKLNWSGHYLINPWVESGLVDLADYPRLEAYLKSNLLQLKGRHIAKNNPNNWYRTIDRVNCSLTNKAKLYIPDIKERITPILDTGGTYPHHNLYFVQSDVWDVEVLGGLLLSDIAQLFVECYGVRMRGGYLRFQAQYLRKIRVPKPKDVSSAQAKELKLAFRTNDSKRATKAALDVYKIDFATGDRLGY